MARKNVLTARSNRGTATAAHRRDGSHDLVEIGNLRVLVTKDGPWWFAQGLEIDYTAQGRSLDEVKDKFARGLMMTVDAYLEEYGSIEKLLRFAPTDVLRELSNAKHKKLLTVTMASQHELKVELGVGQPVINALPFEGISYFERHESAAHA